MSSQKNSDDVKLELAKMAHIFRSVFNTDDGKLVLKKLEEEFDRDNIMSDNPHRTHYNLGRRDAVVYIRQMLNFKVEV